MEGAGGHCICVEFIIMLFVLRAYAFATLTRFFHAHKMFSDMRKYYSGNTFKIMYEEKVNTTRFVLEREVGHEYRKTE